MPVELWGKVALDAADRLRRVVQAGIGDRTMEKIEAGKVALHWRRAMTEAEEAGIAHIIRARLAGTALTSREAEA